MTNAGPSTTEADARTAQTLRARGWWALVQVVVLVGLTCWAFRAENVDTFRQAVSMVQSSYVLAAPVMIALLIYCRREHLQVALYRGSIWGVAVLALALALYAVTTWPFYFGYPRKLTFVLALVGIVLAVGGWRVLWRSLPMVLLAFLAMPLGWYSFGSLISRPERMMVRGTATVLGMLPATRVTESDGDLSYTRRNVEGTIGLGDFHFGFAAPMALASAILFAIFARVRPWWQVIALFTLVGPLVVLGNFVRLILHGCLTIFLVSPPTSGLPRNVSTVVALVLTYGGACLAIRLLNSLFVDAVEEDVGEAETA